MKFIRQKLLSESDKRHIIHLWNTEYPVQLNYKSPADFDNYIEKLDERSHILMIDENEDVKGWCITFEREGEKWFAIILDASLQGKGLGTQLLELAKETEQELNGWVVDHINDRKQNGDMYRSPLMFYMKNGFDKLDDSRLELPQISAVKIRWRK